MSMFVVVAMVVLLCSVPSHAHPSIESTQGFANDSTIVPTWIPFPTASFEYYLKVQASFYVFWKVTGPNEVSIGVASQSGGWLAIGLSDNGGMKGADIMIVYTSSDGAFHLEDRHSKEFGMPSIDAIDDLHLTFSMQRPDLTAFTFTRPLSSNCISEDLAVRNDGAQQFLLYAFDLSSNVLSKHEHLNRGTRSIVFNPDLSRPAASASAHDHFSPTMNIRTPKFSVPNATTSYCFSLHHLGDPATTMHAIEFEPLIASPVLHHLVLWGCPNGNPVDTYPQLSGNGAVYCTLEQNPSSVCSQFVIAWAVGGYGQMLPRDTSIPIGGPSGFEYYVLEAHYNNEAAANDIVDESGFAIAHSEQPLTMEIRTLTLGMSREGLVIPPGRSRVDMTSVCPANCTSQFLPMDGLDVYASFFHMHRRGVSLDTRIVRQGTEVDRLRIDYFDFMYQNPTYAGFSTRMLPGDDLITTCTYNTRTETEPLRFGLPSSSEMCFSFVQYIINSTTPKSSVLTSCLGMGGNQSVCRQYQPNATLQMDAKPSMSFAQLPMESVPDGCPKVE